MQTTKIKLLLLSFSVPPAGGHCLENLPGFPLPVPSSHCLSNKFQNEFTNSPQNKQEAKPSHNVYFCLKGILICICLLK